MPPMQNIFARPIGIPQAPMQAAPASNMMRMPQGGGLQNVFAQRAGAPQAGGKPSGPPVSGPVAMQPQPAPAQTPVPGQPPAPISNMGVGAPGQPPPQNVFAMRPAMAG